MKFLVSIILTPFCAKCRLALQTCRSNQFLNGVCRRNYLDAENRGMTMQTTLMWWLQEYRGTHSDLN